MTRRKVSQKTTNKKGTSLLNGQESAVPQKSDVVLVKFLGLVMKLFLYSGVFVCGGIVTLMLMVFICGGVYLRTVSSHAGISEKELLSIMKSAPKQKIAQFEEKKNIVILGIDSLSNRDTDNVLTDTIMVVSAGTNTGKIHTFSLPRDLYIASYSAKINALYQKEKMGEPVSLSRTITDITGLPIHHTIALDIQTVGKLIDALGGLDIEVERSFVDYRFPRTDVDVRTERNESKLYEIVSFTKGVEHMTGDRALRYIRSRHSIDPEEGTDDARVKRQQRVISALLLRLKDPSIVRRPEEIGKLLKLYREHFEASIPLTEVSALGYTYAVHKQFPQLFAHQLSIKGNGKEGVLYHPETHVSGAWVYLPVDPTYIEIKNMISEWMIQ